MMSKSEILNLNISNLKRLDLLQSMSTSKISGRLKYTLHGLSILSTTNYLSGMFILAVYGVMYNYSLSMVNDVAKIILLLLGIAMSGSLAWILEISTLEAGARVSQLYQERSEVKRSSSKSSFDSDFLNDNGIALRKLVILFLILSVMQVLTFSLGAINSAKIVQTPKSVEGDISKNKADIEFANKQIEIARHTVTMIDTGSFKVTQENLGSYSAVQEKAHIDMLYAKKLEDARREVKSSKEKYQAYLDMENQKEANFVNGELNPYARKLYEEKKSSLLSEPMANLKALEIKIGELKASVKKTLTPDEYLELKRKRAVEIINLETSNLSRYKLHEKKIEKESQKRQDELDARLSPTLFIVVGFFIYILQVLVEIWHRSNKEDYMSQIDLNISNHNRNTKKRESTLSEFSLEPKEEESKDDYTLVDIESQFGDIYNFCVNEMKNDRSVPTRKELTDKFSERRTRHFRSVANNLMYVVDSLNGNQAEWSRIFKDKHQ